MFDKLKSMANMAGLMGQLPVIKARMEQVKKDLERITVEAQTGGGAVRAVANCHLRIVNVRVDQAMLSSLVDSKNEDDRAMAEDLIAGAVNAALEKAKERAEVEFAAAARDLDLPLPGAGTGLST